MHEAIVLASDRYGKLVAGGDGGARSVMLADGGGDAISNFRVVGLRARSLSSEPRTERKLRANRDRNLVAAGGNKRAQLQLLKSYSHNVTTTSASSLPIGTPLSLENRLTRRDRCQWGY